MREAAKNLGISRTSLEKWIRRINETEEKKPPEQRKRIEPQRHEWDWRFYTITDEDVERIRQARSQMPERVARPHTSVIPSYSSLAFDRRSAASDDMLVPYEPIVPRLPTPRPRPPRIASSESRSTRHGSGEASGALPDGMMSIAEAERLHGIPASNIRHWTNQGIIEADPGSYENVNGRFPINRPITRKGMAQFYAKAVEWERARAGRSFTRCPDCPHDELDVLNDISDE
jgi:transposase-like protein